MASVDDRVVSMQFDNKSFEQRISATLGSIEKLKKSLDFANENRNLSGLSKAAGSFNMDGLGVAADHIASKFTAMGAIAFSVINNLTTRALDAGLRIVKAFSLAPVMSGFQEYQTNLNSIQTILANTASDNTTLDQVNAALNKLNVYSDQTIYNFSEMAKNIGTFTAAGVNLDTSVNAIKGIANLAALSGSNSEQASTAMYQLSQAISTGTLKLIDWNSVTNAGIGGEIFKKSLFETGKALGTLTDVPVKQTFEEWEKANGSFRDSLQNGWITAEVLTTTLAGFTGDLSEEMLIEKGYTQQQATNIVKIAKTAQAAATEVKTFSQLVGTVKEAIGTGWADTFGIVIGNFTEAKALWTGVNNSIGQFVSNMSSARNVMLQQWKDMGGRDILINNLKMAFKGLGDVVNIIHDAFRQIFPPSTAQQLVNLTVGFGKFIERLTPAPETLAKLQRVFAGVFAVLDIGWTVIKNVARVFGELFSAITQGIGGGTLDFFANLGDSLVSLDKALVKGGGITRFFDRVVISIKEFFGLFQGGFSAGVEGVSVSVGRLSDRFGFLGSIVDSLGKSFGYLIAHFDKVRAAFGKAFSAIGDAFKNIGHSIADTMKTGNFDEVFDIINTGLIGGILLIIRKFMKNGFKNFGGGIFTRLNKIFNELTGVLKAMQTELKAEALLKIAEALGVLAASLLVLSLIDSAALTKALVAMGISFAQLGGMMVLLSKIGGIKSATTVGLLAGSMIALSTAILVLSAAVKVFSTMSWSELLKGMTAVAATLGLMAATVKLMPNSGIMLSTGIALTAVATAVRILANAVQAFAGMSWSEMGKGLAGVATSLAVLAAASHLISPSGMLAAGAGLIGVAVGLNVLVGAIAMMGHMNISTLIQGLAGVGAALLVIAGAMQLMPITLPITGAGLVLVGIGLNAVATALLIVSKMNWGELAKGLAGTAGALGILAIATMAMQGTIAGSASILIAATAMGILAKVVKEMSDLSWGDLAHGLGGLAASLGVLAAAAYLITPSIPSLLGLGAALILVGAGFALFGIGAAGVANALKLIADTGSVAITALIAVFNAVIDKLPEFTNAMTEGMIKAAAKLMAALPGILSHFGDVLVALFKALQQSIPELAKTFMVIIDQILLIITTKFPDFVAAGLQLLINLLQGILNNIGQVTATVVQIVATFILALAANAGLLIQAGLTLLTQLLLGIANNIQMVIDAAFQIIISIVQGIANGLVNLVTAGGDAIISFIEGITGKTNDIITAGTDAVISFIQGLGTNAIKLANAAGDVIVDFINGLADAIDTHASEIRDAGWNLAKAMLDGMTLGVSDGIGGVVGAIKDGIGSVVSAPLKILGIGGPSKVFMSMGSGVMEGLAIGIEKDRKAVNAGTGAVDNVVTSMNRSIAQLASIELENIQPTIAPVVDLSNVRKSASEIDGLMNSSILMANASFDKAAAISVNAAANAQNGSDSSDNKAKSEVVRDIKFEQVIHSPKSLSAADIYRNTKSQFALAKEELAS